MKATSSKQMIDWSYSLETQIFTLGNPAREVAINPLTARQELCWLHNWLAVNLDEQFDLIGQAVIERDVLPAIRQELKRRALETH